MNKSSEKYNKKVEIPISAILETIFSSDNKDVETLCRWALKYGFVDFEDNYYKLQDDYTKQSFYILLNKEERKQYDYEDYLSEENDKLQNNWNELKKSLEEKIEKYKKDIYSAEYRIGVAMSEILKKMKELESKIE